MKQVLIGRQKGTANQIYLTEEARRLGNYMVGLQGSGKTNLLAQIALQDIENGDGVCVITPHPDLIQDILRRIPRRRHADVIVIDPTCEIPIGLNVFEWGGAESGVEAELVVDHVVMSMFKELWEEFWGPRMEELMRVTAQVIVYCQTMPPEQRPTLREFEDVIGKDKHPAYRDCLLQHIRDFYKAANGDPTPEGAILDYWNWLDSNNNRDRAEIVLSTLNKVRQFKQNRFLVHTVAQSENKLNLKAAMDEGKILLVELPEDKIGEGNVKLLGSLLVVQLYLHTIQRSTNNPKQFHIIADEFGYFAIPAFAKLQARTRKFGVDILVAHQERFQLTEATKGSTRGAKNWIVFQVEPEDAKELAQGFDSTPPPSASRGKQQDFGLATMPWDELKRQSHNNTKIVKVVYFIDELAFQGKTWVASDEQIDEFFAYAPKGISPEDYEKFFTGFKDMFGISYQVTVFTYNIGKRNVALLNQYLYLRMSKRQKEANSVLEKLINSTTFLGVVPQTKRYLEDFWNQLPYIRATDDRSVILEQVMRAIVKKIKYKFWGGVGDEDRTEIIGVFLAYQTQLLFQENVVYLGDLLTKEPIYTRGGEPQEMPEAQRSFGDVTEEWKNRFAHLPQYEAWVRIQQDGHIREYQIKTNPLANTVNSVATAKKLRSQSQQHYGMARSEIEEAIKRRMKLSNGGGVQLYQEHED